jgi:restriction endonuclease S subunit
MNTDLPKGWASTTVGRVIEDLRSGFASGEKSVEGGVAHLRMNNIGLKGELVLDLVRVVPKTLAKPDYDLRRGDVLVCTTNSGKLVGKCAYFDIPGRFAFSNHLSRLRPKAALIDGRFLRWNLWLSWKSGAFDDKCKHWVNQSTIPKEALLETELVLPPRAEQLRIMAKVERLLSRVDNCESRLTKIPGILKRFRQSVLAAACSGRLTVDWRNQDAISESGLPASWSSVEFGTLISDGPQNGLYKPAKFYGKGALIVRIDAFYDGTIAPWSELKRISLTDAERSQFALRNGDILVNRVNSPKFLGKSALVRHLKEPCVYESNMMRLRLDNSRILSTYAILYLQSLMGLSELRKNAKHAVNQSSINQEDVRSALINLPPLEEQHEIVRRVYELFSLADTIEAGYKAAQKRVDHLTPSVLSKSFQGEIVPTEAELAEAEGRDYETAEQLLHKSESLQPDGVESGNGKRRSRLKKAAN